MNKQRNIYKKSTFDFLHAAIVPLAFTGAVLVLIISGLLQADESASAEGTRILDESIRRAVVMSYAIEGRYPPDIEYIEEHYGIHIDKTKYAVHYDIIASNIMPDIVVIEIN